MAEKVVIKFMVDTIQAGQKLMDLGSKITSMGMRISAAFTLPLAGLFAALKNNEVFAKAFQPIQDAFGKIITDLATALIPILNELRPALVGLAGDIGNMFKSFVPVITGMLPAIKDLLNTINQVVLWFTNLNPATKETIVKFLLFGAVLGPALFGLGQMIYMVGALMKLLPLLTGGLWAALAPLLAIAAAIFALIKLVQMDEFKKLAALVAGGAAGWVTGNNKVAAMATANTYANLGGGQAGGLDTGNFVREFFGGVGAPSNGSQVVIPINYAPTLSTASQQELEKNLGPIIRDVVRQNPGR